MMISSGFGHQQPVRPATSPVPNFFGGNQGAGTAARSGAKHGASRGSAAATAAHVRLRPLPPKGGFGMSIEGTKTGQERAVSAVVPRETVAKPPTTPATRRGSETPPTGDSTGASAEVERLKQRNKKLEADLRRANDLVKRKTTEADNFAQQLAEASSALAAANQRHEDAFASSTSRAAQLERDLTNLKAQLDSTRRDSALKATTDGSERDRLLREMDELKAQHAAALQAVAAERDKVAKERDGLATKLASEAQRVQSLEVQLGCINSELSIAKNQIEEERIARQKSDTMHLAKQGTMQRELEDAKEVLKQWQKRIEQVDAFIVQICQPQFAVVKDESLTPLEPTAKAADKPEGFVMVPLQLLLQGYGLLPGDRKKGIADQYEATKKTTP